MFSLKALVEKKKKKTLCDSKNHMFSLKALVEKKKKKKPCVIQLRTYFSQPSLVSDFISEPPHP
jgi:hypothetical protein